MNFAIDMVTGSVFRRRDLTLLWPEWRARVEDVFIEIATPPSLRSASRHIGP